MASKEKFSGKPDPKERGELYRILRDDLIQQSARVARVMRPLQVQGILIDKHFLVPKGKYTTALYSKYDIKSLYFLAPHELQGDVRKFSKLAPINSNFKKIRAESGPLWATLMKLKYAFWDCYCEAQDLNRRIKMDSVLQGICEPDFWYETVVPNKTWLRFVVTPPQDWNQLSSYLLWECFERVHDFIRMPMVMEITTTRREPGMRYQMDKSGAPRPLPQVGKPLPNRVLKIAYREVTEKRRVIDPNAVRLLKEIAQFLIDMRSSSVKYTLEVAEGWRKEQKKSLRQALSKVELERAAQKKDKKATEEEKSATAQLAEDIEKEIAELERHRSGQGEDDEVPTDVFAPGPDGVQISKRTVHATPEDKYAVDADDVYSEVLEAPPGLGPRYTKSTRRRKGVDISEEDATLAGNADGLGSEEAVRVSAGDDPEGQAGGDTGEPDWEADTSESAVDGGSVDDSEDEEICASEGEKKDRE